MFTRFFGLAAVCIVTGSSTLAADQPNRHPGMCELAPGDWYQVQCSRGDVTDDGLGMVVSADDEWITLAFIVRARTEQGVPVLSKTPYVNRLFKNVGLSASHVTVFLPRAAVSQASPMESPSADDAPTTIAEFPQPGETVSVVYAEDGERCSKRGKLVSIDDEEIVVACSEVVGNTSRVPIMSDIPWLGSIFTRQVFTRRDVKTHIAADRVLSIGMSAAPSALAIEKTASIE